MKFLFITLDGGGDVGEHTPYQTAKKPNIDMLAKKGICGLVDIGYKGTPQSDVGYLTLLGFYSSENYPGRGYLEALGVGMRDIQKEDLCIRGNFATLDENGNILDRRAARDETGLDELSEKLNGIEINGIQFRVRRSSGHRIVIILHPIRPNIKLSEHVTSNDPERIGAPILQIKPRKPEAKFTASVLNKFVSRAHKILSAEYVNRQRKFPANIILMRGFGKRKETQTFGEKYGMTSCCIAGIPIVKGVALYLGMDIISVPGATGYPDTDLEAKFRHAKNSLERYDFVWLHINGTDILSHDCKRREKAGFIEKIDTELGKILKEINLKKTVIVITSDHRTASSPDYPHYRHTKDPVPTLVSGDDIKANSIDKFDERSCERGFFIKGNNLMRFIFDSIKT